VGLTLGWLFPPLSNTLSNSQNPPPPKIHAFLTPWSPQTEIKANLVVSAIGPPDFFGPLNTLAAG